MSPTKIGGTAGGAAAGRWAFATSPGPVRREATVIVDETSQLVDARPTMKVVSWVNPTAEKELVVAEDGSIPAEQLARLGLRPGAHLRVVEPAASSREPAELEGLLPDLPDLDWGDFERGSELAQGDLSGA